MKKGALWVAAGVLAFLRLWYLFHLRVDQDETQHLHTIWAIGHGQEMYRDVFDNHMPLFHFLCAPLMRWAGEREDIVMVMRFAVLPFFIGALLLVRAITRALQSDARTAGWAAIFAGLFPVFLFTGTEFRPDQLWTVFWLAAILVLLRGAINPARSFCTGLLLGFAMAVSMKTVLMLASLAGGALVAFAVGRRRPAPGAAAKCVAALAAGLVIAPAGVGAWFAARGHFDSFWYGIVGHNVRYAHDASGLRYWRMLAFPAFLALVLWGSRAIGRSSPSAAVGMRRVFVFATGGVYFALLFGFWTVLNNETYLPGIAALAPALAAAASPSAAAIVAAVELVTVLVARPPIAKTPAVNNELIAQTLALTGPDDFVMDKAGETVFRKRPFFLLIETLTRDALKRGAIPDTIAQDIAATGTCVVVKSGDYPSATSDYLGAHFVPFGHLLVAGQTIHHDPKKPGPTRFEIAVPAVYAFLVRGGDLVGTLDGEPYANPRFLAAGVHEIEQNRKTTAVIAVWDRAVEHGFTFERDHPAGAAPKSP